MNIKQSDSQEPNLYPEQDQMEGSFDYSVRRQTEEYWRTTIVNEILDRIELIPKEDGGYCHVVHYCDVVELIELSKGKR